MRSGAARHYACPYSILLLTLWLFHRAIVCGFEEDVFDFGGEFAVNFAGGAGLRPVGIGTELVPACFGGIAAIMLQEVDESVLRSGAF